MQPSIIDIVLSITALSRSELEMLAERLVNDFPERADQLSFLLHVEFSDKFLGADHRNLLTL